MKKEEKFCKNFKEIIKKVISVPEKRKIVAQKFGKKFEKTYEILKYGKILEK